MLAGGSDAQTPVAEARRRLASLQRAVPEARLVTWPDPVEGAALVVPQLAALASRGGAFQALGCATHLG